MSSKTAWKTLSTRSAYRSDRMNIRIDEFELPNGKKGVYEIVERKNFVLVIPRIGEYFYLVNQFRYPVSEDSLEFPEGGINTGETPEQAAHRELTEETGLTTDTLKHLGFLYSANGHATQGYDIFLADNCKHGERRLDNTEYGMETKKLTLQELKESIRNGSINDSPTAAALALYLSYL